MGKYVSYEDSGVSIDAGERMVDDMDVNAGQILQPGVDMAAVAADLLNLVIAVASGQPSKSEAQGVGEDEFIPWDPGGIL